MGNKKTKLLTISDIPVCSSGVGNQSMILFKGLLDTGKYTIRSIGGAINHQSYNPIIFDEKKYDKDFIIYPVKDFGDAMFLRQMMDMEKPDALLLVTDPRFFIWTWEIWDEIHPRMPILYWHLWDNYPVPKFNKTYYDSCDFIGCINSQTCEFVPGSESKTPFKYIPHALPDDMYFPLDESLNKINRKKFFGDNANKCVFLYVGRNARRKSTSNILEAFSWLNKKYNDTFMAFHSDPNDREGPSLIDVVKMLGLVGNKDVIFVMEHLPIEGMREFYNASDFIINCSSAEGYGLPIQEAMTCGTRAIANKTGGLKDQIIDPDLGRYLDPDAKFLAGAQGLVPYIYDDYLDSNTIFKAMEEEYLEWKKAGRVEIRKRVISKIPLLKEKFNYNRMISDWDSSIQETLVRHKEELKNHKISVGEF